MAPGPGPKCQQWELNGSSATQWWAQPPNPPQPTLSPVSHPACFAHLHFLPGSCRHLCLWPNLCMHTQSYPTLCDLVDYSPQGPSVHGVFQARILEQVAISYFRASSWPRNQTHVLCIPCVSCNGRWVLYHCDTWEALVMLVHLFKWHLPRLCNDMEYA